MLEIGDFEQRENKLEIRNIDGGILVQGDTKILSIDDFKIVTVKKPTEKDLSTALFTWKVLRHAKSNGILISKTIRP